MSRITSAPSAPDMDEPETEAGVETNLDTLPGMENTTDDNGQVMTLEEEDMDLLARAMNAPIKQLHKATILPIDEQLVRLWNLLTSKAKYSQMLRMVHLLARTGTNYRLPIKHHQIDAAALLDDLDNLTIEERQILALAPVNLRDEQVKATFIAWANSLTQFQPIDLKAWAESTGTLDLIQADVRTDLNAAELLQIESFHRSLSLYLWLSYRLQISFREQSLARDFRERAEVAIEVNLSASRMNAKQSRPPAPTYNT